MKRIGPSFWDELVAAGLSGISMSWGDNGQITFGDDMTQDQKDTVMVVLAAHDPGLPPPKADIDIKELVTQMIKDGTMTQAKIDAIKASR